MLTSIRGQQLVISSLFCVLCFHSSITVDGLRVPNRYNVEDCKNELRLGLQTLQDMSVRIADHEFGRRDKLKKKSWRKKRKTSNSNHQTNSTVTRIFVNAVI
ncbi:hypothetical protein M3Y98_00678600 [Aphelenchoides besseyi]|nr:hypothetical protein M3Y98_00678600 [Aphelenchoides besseyi]